MLTTLSLFLLPLAATAQNSQSPSFLPDLLATFRSLGYNTLADAATQLGNSSEGQNLLSSLSEGNFTIFAPTDQAFAEAQQQSGQNLSANDTALLQTVAYHILPGNFVNETAASNSSSGSGSNGTTGFRAWNTGGGATGSNLTDGTPLTGTPANLVAGIYPNITIGRTLLNDSSQTPPDAARAQVLSWAKGNADSPPGILNQPTGGASVTNSTLFNNLLINGVDHVLVPPPDLSVALGPQYANTTALSGILNSTTVPGPDGNNITLAEALQGGSSNTTSNNTQSGYAQLAPGDNTTVVEGGGFTLFAPTDEALQADQSTLQGLQSNQSQLLTVLQNHYINGSTVYANQLSDGGYVSAAGEPINLSTNETGTFVNVGNASALITRPDVLTDKGVVHVIDRLLLNPESDPAAASSAYESATAAALAPVSETGPIGGEASATATPASSESSAAPSSTESSPSSTDTGGGATPSAFNALSGAASFDSRLASLVGAAMGVVVGGFVVL